MNNNQFYTLKKKLISGFLILLTFPVAAQTAAPAGDAPNSGLSKILDVSLNTWLLVFLFFMMALTIYVLYTSFMRVVHSMEPRKPETFVTATSYIPKEKKPNFWTRFDRKFLTRAIPVEQEADVMLDHNYDGIRELDNALPPWWKWGFYITIMFAVCYLIGYHVSGVGKLQLDEYKDELAKAEVEKTERMKLAGENINEENVVALADAAALEEGKNIFTKNCVACHRADGGGQVGPNLTDDFWLHGGGIKNVFKTIANGVPAKGMISWKAQLAPKQIQRVASFILTLHGTNPPSPKEPQGDKWVEVPSTPTDSTAIASADSSVKKLK